MGVSPPLLSAISTPMFFLGHFSIVLSKPASATFADILYLIGVGTLAAINVGGHWWTAVTPPNYALALCGFLLSCVYCHWLSVKPSFSFFACWISAVLIFLHGLFLIAPEIVGEISGELDLSQLATEYLGSVFPKEWLPYFERIPYHGLPIASGVFLFANTNGYLSLKSKSALSIFGQGLKMTASLGLTLSHILLRVPSLSKGFNELQVDTAVAIVCIIPLVITMMATDYQYNQNKTVRRKPATNPGGSTPQHKKTVNVGESYRSRKKKGRRR